MDSIDRHFETLCTDVARFSAAGSVLLMGDFNAHVACAPETLDLQITELEAMQASNVPIAPSLLQFAHLLEAIGPRASSANQQLNVLGERVLDMCSSHRLMIMNGRLPGDENGKCTFFSRANNNTRCMLDLMIGAPALVVDENNRFRAGCRLHVLDPSDCPLRPDSDDGTFDHMPVFLSFPLPRVAIVLPESDCGRDVHSAALARWVESLRPQWVDVLTNNEEVQQHLRDVLAMDGNVDGVEANRRFCMAITRALHALESATGVRVTKTRGSARTPKRVHQPWYDDDCKRARKYLRHAEHVHGDNSLEAAAARRAYWTCVRSAKRCFEFSRLSNLMEQCTADPRSFWKSFQDDGRCADGPSDMSQWTGYFQQLLDAVGKSAYVGGTLEAHCQHYADLYGLPPAEAVDAAAGLNQPFGVAEVIKVLCTLNNHKAAGVDGVPAEFYKHARYHDGQGRITYVLAPYLTRVFNAVLRGGYPADWAVSALVPVPKPKANHSSCDGFRGIAVGPALGKIYSMLLMCRMDAWAERHCLRANGQAGFRVGRSTVDNVFVLRHVISTYKAQNKPVYAAFIDFKKAYDCVDRDLLWKCLEHLGLHGATLRSLQDMHANVQMRVRLRGCLGDSFPANRGVRQGDPLSPLLFGLFIDRFESFLAARCAGQGVRIGRLLLQLLLYADDLVLLAESKADLQAMLNVLSEFCRATCMTVNVSKSEIVIFNAATPAISPFIYNGETMPVKPFFVYLGVKLDSATKSVVSSVLTGRVAKARAAMYAMFSRCYELRLHNVHMQCRLFDALVVPVLNYGCEVWGAEHLGNSNVIEGCGAAELLHFSFLRQSLGVRASTARAVMLRETGRCHMNVAWFRQALNFFNRVMKRNDSDVVRHACLADLAQARDGSTSAWSAHMAKCMHKIECGQQADVFLNGRFCPVDDLVCAMEKHQWRNDWKTLLPTNSQVRAVPNEASVGFKLLTYAQWFKPADGALPGYLKSLHSRSAITAVARFRLGSHSLGIETGRRGHKVPRDQRCCTLCEQGARDDEWHVLTCPGLHHLRQHHFHDANVFAGATDDSAVNKLMNGTATFDNSTHFWSVFSNYIIDVTVYKNDHDGQH